MPGGNGIKLILTTAVLLCSGTITDAQQYPIVIGYERFHSEAPSIEGGRILFNELGCVNCHNHVTGLPERKGPDLGGILQRSHPDWVGAFLKDPAETKPGTTMPQMHLMEREIEAVLHYLASLKPVKEIPDAFRFVNAERGLALYHEFGCAACHEPSPDFHPVDGKPDKKDFTYPHVPLPDLKQKYDFNSLSAFLYEPHDYWPLGRMPKFELEREDGGDLAAFLLDFHNGDSTEYPSIEEFDQKEYLVKIGKDIVELRNCSACHTLEKTDNPRHPVLNPMNRGYADFQELQKHPQYELTEGQSSSLHLYLNADNSNIVPVSSHLQTLNCMACHERNGIGGPDAARKTYFSGNHDLGDSGLYPPPLTGIGRKLNPDWLRNLLKETNREPALKPNRASHRHRSRQRWKKKTAEPESRPKVRPYLKTQMPVFGESVRELPNILIEADRETHFVDLSNGDLEAGRKLLGNQGGLNCITCHNWGNRQSLGIRALNLNTMADRLNPGWLYDYLINPADYRPNTLMPSFWPNGLASNQEILGGDTTAQIASIYEFAKSGEGLPEGFPDRNSTEYEIIPTDQPIVQRSFMEGIGTHVILVGFPEGVHLAFNTMSGQPAMMWKGRFFDAYDTWYSRFPKFEKPLGVDLVRWSNPRKKALAQYRGYRVDSGNVPEFILTLNGAEVYERFTPQYSEDGKLGMLRVIRYSRLSQLEDKRLKHPRNTKRKEQMDNDPMTRTFFYQW
jgi:cytochrome c2